MPRIFCICATLAIVALAAPTAHAQSDAAEITFWQSVENSKNPSEFEAYLIAYPNGKFAPLARIRMESSKSATAPPPAAAAKTPAPAVAAAPAAADPNAVHECDRLAGFSGDPHKVFVGPDFIKIDTARAIPACRQAVSEQPDNPRFLYELGRALRSAKQFTEGIEITEKAARLNYVVALKRWAKPIPAASGRPRMTSGRSAITSEAAELGFQAAMYRVGVIIIQSNKVGKDYAKALKWLHKAADMGSTSSLTALGMMSAHGYGVPQDYAEAAKYYQQAADKGEAWGMNNLAGLYLDGKGVARDVGKAAQLYRQAAEKANAAAMEGLANIYYNGRLATPDYNEAMTWYRKAADKGRSNAMRMMAFMYSRGLGVEQNWAEAVRWARKAADSGEAKAMFYLGNWYAEGKGVTKDIAQAKAWYEKAAKLGEPHAMYNLGWLLSREGSDAYSSGALGLLQDAAAKGHAEAMVTVGELYYKGHGVRKDRAEAVRWFKMAAEKKQPIGYYYLAFCYNAGIAVDKDPERAASYLIDSLKGGYQFAGEQAKKKFVAWTPATRKELQRKLRAEGVYDGPVNGKPTEAFEEAAAKLLALKNRRQIAKTPAGNGGDLGLDKTMELGELN